MLVLTRRIDESLLLGDDIKITILKIGQRQVELGISAPIDVVISREEVYNKNKHLNISKLYLYPCLSSPYSISVRFHHLRHVIKVLIN